MSKLIEENLHCFHCGEPVKEERRERDDRTFCCQGCYNVYSLLHESGLAGYYELGSEQGLNLNNIEFNDAFAFLDSEDIAASLIDFNDGQLTRIRFHLPQIHCASCIWLLENLKNLNNGIISSRVFFTKKEIEIKLKTEEIKLSEVAELLTGLGYKPEINLTSTEESHHRPSNRKLYYQLGLAGFCFGNIMLMSFPEYLGISGEFSSTFKWLFRWFNAVLSLPVLFFCAQDYLESALGALKSKVLNLDVPIVIGIIALAGRSWYEVISATGSGYFDSLVGFIFFLLLGKLFQKRTYEHLSFDRDFKSFFPLSVRLVVNDLRKPQKVTDLKIGDRIEILNGEIIPADAVLSSDKAYIDYSFVNGESAPVEFRKGDKIYAGGKLSGSAIQLLVEKPMDKSYLTALWSGDEEKPSETAVLADRAGKYFTLAIILVAGFTLAFWAWKDPSLAFTSFTSVLIVACPCALALSIPFTYGAGMRILAKKGFYMKRAEVLEVMAGLDHLVFDKTGTLSERESAGLIYKGQELSSTQKAFFHALFSQSGHPLSQRLAGELETSEQLINSLDSFEEIPGAGLRGELNGTKLRAGSAEFFGIKPETSSTVVCLELEGELVGRYELSSSFRPGILDMLAKLKNQFSTYLLSGDSDADFNRLRPAFDHANKLAFRQSPYDKKEFIQQLRTQHNKVGMFGDGLNDAGALKVSDLGISVTEDENNFTPAADVIMKGGLLPQLPQILQFSRNSRKLVYLAFALSISYNIIGLSFAVQGLLSPVVSAILMPLSSISIVLFVTLGAHVLAKKIKIK